MGGLVNELIYLSWGGTGRAATLRAALAEAVQRRLDLVYLAVLDDGAFADVDESTLALAEDELSWLLTAQLELTRSQLGAEEVKVRVLIRSGDVADEAAELVATLGDTEVLVGAPVPLTHHSSVVELIDELNHRVSVPVRLVDVSAGLLP